MNDGTNEQTRRCEMHHGNHITAEDAKVVQENSQEDIDRCFQQEHNINMNTVIMSLSALTSGQMADWSGRDRSIFINSHRPTSPIEDVSLSTTAIQNSTHMKKDQIIMI